MSAHPPTGPKRPKPRPPTQPPAPPPMLDDDLPSDAAVAIYEGAHVARVKYAPVSRAVRAQVVRVAARGGVL